MKPHPGWLIILCFLSACSTHPVVDLCDYFKPGKMGPTQAGLIPYGGVGIPQGALVPSVPTVPGVIMPGVVPPPLPLPGYQPGAQLQPPTPFGGPPPSPPTPPPTCPR